MVEPRTTNVVRLATAAPHKVRQPNLTRADLVLTNVVRHPTEFMPPHERERRTRLAAVQGSPSDSMKDSAGLLIAAYLLVFAEPAIVAKLYGMAIDYDGLHRTPETAKAVRLVASVVKGHRAAREPQP